MTSFRRQVQMTDRMGELARVRGAITQMQAQKARRGARAVASPTGLASAFGVGLFVGFLRRPATDRDAAEKLDRLLARMQESLRLAEAAHGNVRRSTGARAADAAKSVLTSMAARYLIGAFFSDPPGADFLRDTNG